MPLSTEDAVRETFRLALQENLAKQLRSDDEITRFNAIKQEAAERVDAERDAFREEYQTRLATARQVILNQLSGQSLNHPVPSWAVPTPPSAETIEVMAQARVQSDHAQYLAAIRSEEVSEYLALRDDCRDRAARERDAQVLPQRGHLKDAFDGASSLSPHEAQTRGLSGPSRS